ncbi:MFS general substrate transporter [Thozetella sp. PMI_491]|nr:MFS general substrate transporter [Thozetella sp. PMI_491]
MSQQIAPKDGGVEEKGGPKAEPHKLSLSKARCIALVATVTGASFLNASVISVQGVVIILPSIGQEMSIPDSRLQWAVSAYSLAFGCFLLFWGRIADIYGKKPIFVAGTAWTGVTLAINPFVHNEILFNLFRGLQGLGAAANVPTAIGILGTTFPPGKAKNYAFSAYSVGAPLGGVFGNIMSGFIAEYASWRWVFGANAILCVIAAVAGLVFIPSTKETRRSGGAAVPRPSVDWLGAFLVTVGLLVLMFALTEGNVVGWRTPWVPVLLVVSLGFIVLFVLWQHRLEKAGGRPPLMKVSIFRNRTFSAAMAIMALFFGGYGNYAVFTTYFYQDYQGLGPLQTMLRFIPSGIAGVTTAVVVSKLVSRLPAYLMLLTGTVAVAIANMLFAIPIPSDTTYWAYGLPAMVLAVIGPDIATPSLTLFTSHSVSQDDQALGGALINAMAFVGRSIGLAIATAVQTAVMARERGVDVQNAGKLEAWDEPSLLGIRAANWFSVGLTLASTLLVAVSFRGSGIIGKLPQRESRTGAVME